jgi:GntR family transcriptional regulator, transcriptional repressor for pyruvate dehydrogenase complex
VSLECPLCYSGPVVEPVRRHSLPLARTGVKAPQASRVRQNAREAQLIEPIRKTRVHEEIADRIRQLILEGTYPPGEPLPSERVLAARLGVSRGSVRDALHTLEVLGLLEPRHGQGTFPRELSVERLVTPLAQVLVYRRDLQDELMDVRRMFEPAVARAAATRVTDEDVAELERVIERQRRKIGSGRSAIGEDTEFHAAMARATHNRVAVRLMATLNDLLMESRKLTLKQRGRPERSLRGHEAIVRAMRRRDAGAAEQAMHDHIDEIAALLTTSGGAPDRS